MSMGKERQLILPALQAHDWAPHAAWDPDASFSARRVLLMGFRSLVLDLVN
jgi:hypothetical protein